MNKVLASESRIDRHDQHLIGVRQHRFEYRRRGCGIDRNAGAFPQRFDALYSAMQIVVALTKWTRNESDPASTNSSRKKSGFEIIM
jgi:hypothetical protein